MQPLYHLNQRKKHAVNYNEQTAPPPSAALLQAHAMGLPKVLWQSDYFRIVAHYDEESGIIVRTPERLEGYDTLLTPRWRALPNAEWNEQAYRHIAHADWVALADALIESAAPLPNLEDTGPGSGTDSPATSEPQAQAREDLAISADKRDAETALFDAYTSVNRAYRISESTAIDTHLMVVQDALEKLATALGLDPFREHASEPLSSLQGDA